LGKPKNIQLESNTLFPPYFCSRCCYLALWVLGWGVCQMLGVKLLHKLTLKCFYIHWNKKPPSVQFYGTAPHNPFKISDYCQWHSWDQTLWNNYM